MRSPNVNQYYYKYPSFIVISIVATIILFLYPIFILYSFQDSLQYQNISLPKDLLPHINSLISNLEHESELLDRIVTELEDAKPTFDNFSRNISDPDEELLNSLNVFTLVVGGTDGSGTRGVVELLTGLGIKLVVEDPGTFDIDANEVGGWPPVVNAVLEETHSADYQLDQLSEDTLNKTNIAIQKILNKLSTDSKRLFKNKRGNGGVLPYDTKYRINSIKYGFKAPVSMTLVPFWASTIENFKFLHVVRDGRDIAFSSNQGPVNKFYDKMYGNSNNQSIADSIPLKAIRLWSDWNFQVFKWFQDSNTHGKPTRYHCIRTEDLFASSLQQRFAALLELSIWLESSMTIDDVCCLAVSGIDFSSQLKSKSLREQKKSKFGKWEHMLELLPVEFNTSLHEEGKVGLEVFGYVPPQVMYSSDMMCELTTKECKSL